MLYSLLHIEVKTLVTVLFWGNLTSIILILTCGYTGHSLHDRRLSACYSLAKLCQAAGYFFLFFRSTLSDSASVNLGNNLLLAGFYLEAVSMLIIIQERDKKTYGVLTLILVGALLVFNGIEFVYSNSSIKIATASTCAFCILVLPNIKMLTRTNINNFKRVVGIFYLLFTTMLLSRAFYSLGYDISIMTNSFIQSLTFISLVMIMVFGLSAYLMLMKEDMDKIIATLTFTDYLTGLLSRRTFLDSAQRHFDRHKTERSPLTVIFLDIDHFKATNDTYGHPFGDDVLVALGGVIRGTLRIGDLSCRYGGEEFILLLPNTDKSQASHVTARIMTEVGGTSFKRYPEFSFTVSI
ncbi:MAG: diguanylate cyclase, partial [Desulfovibrio sp.]|nr:diguanylate cyclase [Desulfovibrio sp.]